MTTRPKLKLCDDESLRAALDDAYAQCPQGALCEYALLLIAHVLDAVRYPDRQDPVIMQGCELCRRWQQGQASVHEVRQAGFAIHRLAKASADKPTQAALRAVGQAVATAHMREHAMVASDYAVKLQNLLHPADWKAAQTERLWQLACLRRVIVSSGVPSVNAP